MKPMANFEVWAGEKAEMGKEGKRNRAQRTEEERVAFGSVEPSVERRRRNKEDGQEDPSFEVIRLDKTGQDLTRLVLGLSPGKAKRPGFPISDR